MKAAPAVSVSIEAHGASAFGVGLICVWAFLASAYWAWQGGSAVLAMGSMLIVVGSAWSLWRGFRHVAQRLSWDGQHWFLSAASSGAVGVESALRGWITVAIDLDTWVLLRFQADGASFGQRPRWLVLHRSQQPGLWHSLRCAMHSPVPSPTAGDLLARG